MVGEGRSVCRRLVDNSIGAPVRATNQQIRASPRVSEPIAQSHVPPCLLVRKPADFILQLLFLQNFPGTFLQQKGDELLL